MNNLTKTPSGFPTLATVDLADSINPFKTESQEQCVIFRFTYLPFFLISVSTDIGPEWYLVPETEIVLLLKFHYIAFKNLVYSQENGIQRVCWFTSMTMTEFQRTTVDHEMCLKNICYTWNILRLKKILSQYVTSVK